jgi:hypothetical protein
VLCWPLGEVDQKERVAERSATTATQPDRDVNGVESPRPPAASNTAAASSTSSTSQLIRNVLADARLRISVRSARSLSTGVVQQRFGPSSSSESRTRVRGHLCTRRVDTVRTSLGPSANGTSAFPGREPGPVPTSVANRLPRPKHDPSARDGNTPQLAVRAAVGTKERPVETRERAGTRPMSMVLPAAGRRWRPARPVDSVRTPACRMCSLVETQRNRGGNDEVGVTRAGTDQRCS